MIVSIIAIAITIIVVTALKTGIDELKIIVNSIIILTVLIIIYVALKTGINKSIIAVIALFILYNVILKSIDKGLDVELNVIVKSIVQLTKLISN